MPGLKVENASEKSCLLQRALAFAKTSACQAKQEAGIFWKNEKI
jgi:hypothetical protein